MADNLLRSAPVDVGHAVLRSRRSALMRQWKHWHRAPSRPHDGGKLVTWANQSLGLLVQIVRKLAGQVGFQVLPCRWVAERTFCPLRTLYRFSSTSRDWY
jgi:hypothetical protein